MTTQPVRHDYDFRLFAPFLIHCILFQVVTGLTRVTASYRAIELDVSYVWYGAINSGYIVLLTNGIRDFGLRQVQSSGDYATIKNAPANCSGIANVTNTQNTSGRCGLYFVANNAPSRNPIPNAVCVIE